MNVDKLIQFLVVVGESRTADDVHAAVDDLVGHFGFRYFGVLRHPKPHENPMKLVLVGRWPDRWPETYIAKKYVLADPTIRYLGLAQRSFRWRDTITAFRNDPHRPRMERMMTDAMRNGLEDGYIFPVHGRNGLLGNLTVGGQPVDLSHLEMGLFETAAKRSFWKLMEITKQAADLESVVPIDTKMTRREMEVLSYLADGLTSNEISRVLSISNHTVDWYMNGIQDKLNAKNRQHVVALAFRHGLIT